VAAVLYNISRIIVSWSLKPQVRDALERIDKENEGEPKEAKVLDKIHIENTVKLKRQKKSLVTLVKKD